MLGGATARWADLLAFARRAEDLGFDSLWVADHLLMRHRGWEAAPVGAWECWSLLAALAAATTRVELGPLVSCANYRNPALLAKLAETVDEVSGGRLILGMGAGWHEPEFRAFGFPFDRRVSRFEEAIRIVAGLLKDGRVDVAVPPGPRLRTAPAGAAPTRPAAAGRHGRPTNAAADRPPRRPVERGVSQRSGGDPPAARRGRRRLRGRAP
jgi:alkanesulfonate monooxygenase SsuD/methylene tetrahydromethanopterin reductase-like flavin-dependent oxidoreductase (luciferase family)